MPPPPSALPPRRFLILFISALGALTLLSLLFRHQSPSQSSITTSPPSLDHHLPSSLLHEPPIAPKLGNETLKAALGHSAWHLLHTTLSRFPTHPTPTDQQALTTYLYLFARLYPCGECAAHFQSLLQKFPPQVSSRKAAEMWGCHVHNQVNRRLKKAEFDCARVGEAYDCGCGEEGEEGEGKGEKEKKKKGEKNREGDIRVEVERMG